MKYRTRSPKVKNLENYLAELNHDRFIGMPEALAYQ